MLASKYAQSLRNLRINALDQLPDSCTDLPERLTTFECRTVRDGLAAAQLIQANSATLQTLRLGQEDDLVEQYRHTRTNFLTNLAKPAESFWTAIQLHSLPNLRQLDLCGLNLSPIIPTSFEQALPFCRLKRLSIESCLSTTDLLQFLAGTFDFVQNDSEAPQPRITPQLQHFLLRTECLPSALSESIVSFLTAFRGLKTLSLLIENATFMERVSAVIADHGPSLETLVLEARIQPRSNLSLSTSRPFGSGGNSAEESISDICRLCPNLVELGIMFNWHDEVVRLRNPKPLPTLKNLRTIHIRNFPESRGLSQIGDYSIKEYAAKFVEWAALPALKTAEQPKLETLAIGPASYESRSQSRISQKAIPEFLRTHFYCLDWARNRFGRWVPMITGLSEQRLEELREEKPLGGAFEQVWLT